MQTSKIDRRGVLAGFAGLSAVSLSPLQAHALSQGEARALIDRVMGEVQSIINSGASQSRMISRFENLFNQYGDVPVIARSVLGPPARSASSAQLNALPKLSAATWRANMAVSSVVFAGPKPK